MLRWYVYVSDHSGMADAPVFKAPAVLLGRDTTEHGFDTEQEALEFRRAVNERESTARRRASRNLEYM